MYPQGARMPSRAVPATTNPYSARPDAVVRPASSPTVLPQSSTHTTEAEIEAERLWWSESSERQVKELQDAFGAEFAKTTDKLRSDLAACQDKLELMVETERNQRHAAMAELRREADGNQVTMAEIMRTQKELKESLNKIEAELHGIDKGGRAGDAGGSESISQLQTEVREAHQLIMETRREMEKSLSKRDSDVSAANLEAEQTKVRANMEREHTKVALSAVEAAVADLRRELQNCQNCQEQTFNQSAEAEKLLHVLTRDMAEVQEKVSLQGKASDEAQSLHQVMSQSAGDLGRGLEELSNAMIATESRLKKDLESQRRTLESAALQHRADVAQEIEQLSKQLTQSLTDEQSSRALEANVWKTRLDATMGRLGELEASATAQAAGEDLRILKNTLEETQRDVGQLQNVQSILDAECKRLATAPALHGQEDDGKTSEGQLTLDRDVIARVEGLEAKVQSLQLQGAPETQRLETEVKELKGSLPPMTSRLEAIDAELRRQVWESAPLLARVDAVEAEILRLARKSNEDVTSSLQGLREDVAKLKMTYAAKVERPQSVQRGRGADPPARSVSPRRVAAPLPEDLRANIRALVENVNTTLTSSLPGDQADGVSDQASSGPAIPDTATGQGYAEALKAIQELRERNMALREQNAELVQDLNADTPRTPLDSSTGRLPGPLPYWPPSAQISAEPSGTFGVAIDPVLPAAAVSRGEGPGTPVRVSMTPRGRDGVEGEDPGTPLMAQRLSSMPQMPLKGAGGKGASLSGSSRIPVLSSSGPAVTGKGGSYIAPSPALRQQSTQVVPQSGMGGNVSMGAPAGMLQSQGGTVDMDVMADAARRRSEGGEWTVGVNGAISLSKGAMVRPSLQGKGMQPSVSQGVPAGPNMARTYL